MGTITLQQAAAWCGGKIDPKYKDVTFCGANNDTRKLATGELFIALQGARDGHDFIPAALEKGAAAVLCTRCDGDYPAIVVEDTRLALGEIAKQERQRLGVKVVAITGSVGKSTTKEMIATVLGSTYRISKTPANHNNDIGMPMAVLSMPLDTQVAVLEMGMNHFREIAYLSKIAEPDIAVIVNIGTTHMEFLGSQKGIRQAKMEIVEGMDPKGLLLLNGDDTMLWNLDSQPQQRITYFGKGEDCSVQALDVRQDGDTLRFRVNAGKLSFPVEMLLEGEHFVTDAMAAITVALKLAVPCEKITKSLSAFQTMSGRQEIFQKNGFTIIKDCYNAGPESMAAALSVLGNRPGRHIAVIGDMLELGDAAWAEHYKIGRIAAEKADLVFAYGPHSNRVISGTITGGMPENMGRAFEDRDELVQALKQSVNPGDVLLFKASRGMHLEKILEAFLEEEKK